MICPECKGAGEVPDQDYRTSAKPLVEKASLSSRLKNKMSQINWKKIGITTLYVLGVMGGISLVGYKAHSCKQEAVEEQATQEHTKQWEAKMGYVIVQHGANQQEVVRCWITPPRYETHDYKRAIAGPEFFFNSSDYSWIEVPDRNDVAGFARKLGLNDTSKCIKSGQASQ